VTLTEESSSSSSSSSAAAAAAAGWRVAWWPPVAGDSTSSFLNLDPTWLSRSRTATFVRRINSNRTLGERFFTMNECYNNATHDSSADSGRLHFLTHTFAEPIHWAKVPFEHNGFCCWRQTACSHQCFRFLKKHQLQTILGDCVDWTQRYATHCRYFLNYRFHFHQHSTLCPETSCTNVWLHHRCWLANILSNVS